MKCEFEEKQYEQHLNNELLMRQEFLYVPGQVLEGQLGFDAAIYSLNPRFWRLFDDLPYFRPFRRRWLSRNRPGVALSTDWWADLEESLPYFPQFRFNVFVQHKRPEYLTVNSSNEWAHWNRPYFRYQLTPHQQQALEQLESRTQNSAIVVYASPAFIKLEQLWSAIQQRRLIETSNFCQPCKLAGHHLFSYAEAGSVGKAHSDPEDIESFNFYERLQAFYSTADSTKDNRTFLIQLGEQLLASIAGCGALTESFATILGTFDSSVDNDFQQAMARVASFNFAVGARWLVGVQ